jgi:hypothetical protein
MMYMRGVGSAIAIALSWRRSGSAFGSPSALGLSLRKAASISLNEDDQTTLSTSYFSPSAWKLTCESSGKMACGFGVSLTT